MAVLDKVVITISLPKDVEADRIDLQEAATSGGAYSSIDVRDYDGEQTVEYLALIDDTMFYKIQFSELATGNVSPLSNFVAGSDFAKTLPFLAITDRFDGAGYATTAEVYTKTGLTTSYISDARMAELLKEARAYMDVWLNESTFEQWTRSFEGDVARRKYNQQLELQKQAEIAYAASKAYLHVGDENLVSMMENNETPFDLIRIGDLDIGQKNQAKSPDYQKAIQIISDRYYAQFRKYMFNMAAPTLPMEYNSNFGIKRRSFLFPNEVQ